MTMTLAIEIATVLLEIGAVSFDPKNPVTFKSGIKSPVYTNNRRLPFYPNSWRVVIDGFQTVIQEKNLELDVLAGIEAAGIPHSAALGYAMQKPSVFVRKQTKAHGRKKRVEGGDVSGLRVLLIEDLVTTGGSSLSGVEALREEGAVVTDCFAITSYGLPEAAQNFAEANITLHTLTNFEAIWQVAKPALDVEIHKEIESWWKNPHEWGRV